MVNNSKSADLMLTAVIALLFSFSVSASDSQAGTKISDGGKAAPVLLAQAEVEKKKAAKKAKKKDKRVCRKIRTTGSRIAERVCKKQSAWDKTAERSRKTVEDAYDRTATSTTGGDS